MYRINKNRKSVDKIEETTFADIGMKENDVEEILREDIQMLEGEEVSLLVVGKQVRNQERGRSDLTAIDANGNIVLIEIKRDRNDIEQRREPFEFQAIRYAASYATIKSKNDLVQLVYAPYLERYGDQTKKGELTFHEWGHRILDDFLDKNQAGDTFNEKQRIILAASDYDDLTLSSVAWLSQNGVDITCYKLTPYVIGEETYIQVDKLIPSVEYDDYYINLAHQVVTTKNRTTVKPQTKRRSLPKIQKMLEWGVVKAGDVIQAKDKTDEAILLQNGNVDVNGDEKSMQVWLKDLYGWSSIQTYVFAIHKESGQSLSKIRAEYMERMEKME